MKIANLFDVQSFSPKKTNQSSTGSSFKDFIGSVQHSPHGQPTAVTPKQDVQQKELLTEVKNEIKEILGNQLGEDPTINNLSEEDLSSIQTSMNELLNQFTSLEDLLSSTDKLPIGISILALAIKIEDIAKTDGSVDMTQILEKLHALFESEFPSFSPAEDLNFDHMFLALENMSKEDKALLEGQMIISTASEQVLDDLRYYSKLLGLMENPSEANYAKNLLKDSLLADSDVADHLKQILSSDDLSKVKELLTKLMTVVDSAENTDQNNSFNKDLVATQHNSGLSLNSASVPEETFSIQLDKFVQKDQLMTVGENKNTNLLTSTKEEFTNKMIELLKNSRLSQFNNGTSRLVINLTPEHLGSITIRIVQQQNGEMVAKIIAATQSAKELLEHSGSQLRQALPNVNIEFERFEVFTDDSSKFLRENKDPKQGKEHNNQNENSDQEEQNNVNFKDSLNDALNISI
ncbi:flagellar hook-length control protein FliK [Metabacillus litoralis]|uniref:flagellar hook-length control protein FliK n=1 Tax=Metabacillus litoralis TaxID=152268 RepID=UPI001B96242B|nr:flagellar hook-length control protein FliK [Metabacillus litoralis]UHA59287.1 flagellar hook-length control protein FliK [Metabacillus litoralis]